MPVLNGGPAIASHELLKVNERFDVVATYGIVGLERDDSIWSMRFSLNGETHTPYVQGKPGWLGTRALRG
jgi:hypothetical protein